MIIYNINALYNRDYLELASIAAKLLILNGGVNKNQIRVTITKKQLGFYEQITYLQSVVGYNGIQLLPDDLYEWAPKTHIVDRMLETDIIDYIVNVDADCFLTQKIDLDEFVSDKITGYDIAVYSWDTNADRSYRNRLSLAPDFFKSSLTSSYRYRKIVNGILSKSGVGIEMYEEGISTVEWFNGGFTIYANKNLVKQWNEVLALNCITLSDEYVFSIMHFLQKLTDGAFGLQINVLQQEGLRHHYIEPHHSIEGREGLVHLLGTAKRDKEDEIKKLYMDLIVNG